MDITIFQFLKGISQSNKPGDEPRIDLEIIQSRNLQCFAVESYFLKPALTRPPPEITDI